MKFNVLLNSFHTFNQDFFKNLNYWNKLSGNLTSNSYVIYGGDSSRDTKDGKLLTWNDIYEIPVV
jgi:hypothetical protein